MNYTFAMTFNVVFRVCADDKKIFLICYVLQIYVCRHFIYSLLASTFLLPMFLSHSQKNCQMSSRVKNESSTEKVIFPIVLAIISSWWWWYIRNVWSREKACEKTGIFTLEVSSACERENLHSCDSHFQAISVIWNISSLSFTRSLIPIQPNECVFVHCLHAKKK
jgi:hypothetical protein